MTSENTEIPPQYPKAKINYIYNIIGGINGPNNQLMALVNIEFRDGVLFAIFRPVKKDQGQKLVPINLTIEVEMSLVYKIIARYNPIAFIDDTGEVHSLET
jgi:hypothetical protein